MQIHLQGIVAQLVRASACHAEGHEFESRQSRHDLATSEESFSYFLAPQFFAEGTVYEIKEIGARKQEIIAQEQRTTRSSVFSLGYILREQGNRDYYLTKIFRIATPVAMAGGKTCT